jgi:sRNA-binding regulator protein Hfq
MQDSSAIPVHRVVRRGDDAPHAKEKAKVDRADPSTLPSISPAGPRKLVRPPLPEGALSKQYPARVSPISSLQLDRKSGSATGRAEDSHAEAFYFQKQIQSKTLMVFVLEGGEQIEGHIEWFDWDAIKVRHGGLRTLVYKSSIKYLFKAAESPGK